MPLLVVQRGHVPRTSGSTGTKGEQALAMAVAQYVPGLVPQGWDVRIINADEPDSRYRGDAFVAIHADGSDSLKAHGASVGYQTAEGRLLGDRWKRAYRACGWPRYFRSDNYTTGLARYYGVRKAVSQGNRRAIIIECGFLTNQADRSWMQGNERKIAESIVLAVCGHVQQPVVQPRQRKVATMAVFYRKQGTDTVLVETNKGLRPLTREQFAGYGDPWGAVIDVPEGDPVFDQPILPVGK